jgi:hypothetical protein
MICKIDIGIGIMIRIRIKSHGCEEKAVKASAYV